MVRYGCQIKRWPRRCANTPRPDPQEVEAPVSTRRIPLAGDPFYAAGKRIEAELLEALAEDEAKQGRPHTPREREAFARGFFGEEYRQEVREVRQCRICGGVGSVSVFLYGAPGEAGEASEAGRS